MHRTIILLFALIFPGYNILLAFENNPIKRIKTPQVVCKVSNKIERVYVEPPFNVQLKSSGETTAEIVVEYSLFPENAKIAFEYAVSIWENIIQSDIPIHIEANWRTQDKNTLGSAGPSNYYTNFTNIPHQDRYYPVAVAERITGLELNGATVPDIEATFNKDINWYFGIDGQTPDSLHDFVTVVLHEIAHGLGFGGFFYTEDDQGGYFYNEPGDASAYDLLVVKSDNIPLTDTRNYNFPSLALERALTSSDLYSDSPVAILNNNDIKPKLYAPSEFDDGSSVYHTDLYEHPNDLMNHAISKAVAIHDPGKLVKGILDDIGWTHMFLDFDPPKDIEQIEEIQFNVLIKSDYPIDTSSLFIYYSTDKFAAVKDSIALVPGNTSNLFSAALTPEIEPAEIHYYISAKDKVLRTFYLPTEAPSEVYAVKIGPDNEPPVIEHEPIPYFFTTDKELKIEAFVNDNVGVDTVYIEYTINAVPQPSVAMHMDSASLFSGTFNFDAEQLNDGDEVEYKIVATDSSNGKNSSTFPEEGILSFKIEKLLAPVDRYYNDFNNDKNDFIISDFTIYTAPDFTDNALHSGHPYPSPGKDNTFWDFTTVLKHPIILKESSSMSFEEVVLVEPGENGAD